MAAGKDARCGILSRVSDKLSWFAVNKFGPVPAVLALRGGFRRNG